MADRESGGFTPGPWVATDSGVYGAGGCCIAVTPDQNQRLFTPQGSANARLIGAAPELYEALETVESEILLDGHLQEIVSNALAKARGEA